MPDFAVIQMLNLNEGLDEIPETKGGLRLCCYGVFCAVSLAMVFRPLPGVTPRVHGGANISSLPCADAA
jgi:hypothetical protein